MKQQPLPPLSSPHPFQLIQLTKQLLLSDDEVIITPSTTSTNTTTTSSSNSTNQSATSPLRASSFIRVSQSATTSSSSPPPPPKPSARLIGSTSTVGSVELCGNNLFIGTSEGILLHYVLEIAENDDDQLHNNNQSTKDEPPNDQKEIVNHPDVTPDAINPNNSTTNIKLQTQKQPTPPITLAPFKCRLHQKRFLGIGRKSIDEILAVPTESKLVVLCDSSLTFYDMDNLLPISTLPKISGVMSFCGDKLLHSPMRFCVGKRRTLSAMLLDDAVTSKKEIPMPDGALILKRVGSIICAADAGSYKIINLDTTETIPLFPYDRNAFRPTLACVGETGEFLLVTAGNQTQSALGVFVTSCGDPVKGTLQWPMIPKSVSNHFPYIATLLRDNTIHIHNIFSQQLVQIITLPSNSDPRFLVEASFELDVPAGSKDENSGTVRLVVACRDTVLALKMSSLDSQVNELLKAKKVERAVALAEHVMQAQHLHDDGGRRKIKLLNLYKRAGFIYFGEASFEEALAMFKKGQLDPRALLALFPEYRSNDDDLLSMIDDTELVNLIKQAGSISQVVEAHFKLNYPDADLETLDSFRVVLIANARDVLVKYFVFARDSTVGMRRRREIDTTLLRIYAENDLPAMYALLDSNHHVHLEDGEKILTEKQRYYALSLLYQQQGLIQQALEVWIKLASGEYADADFGGIPQIVNYLSKVEDSELVWNYATILLKMDSSQGIRIFTSRVDDKRFTPDDVIAYLKQHHDQDSVSLYYEMLIHEKGIQDEEIHTSLVMIYVNRVLELASDEKLACQEAEFRSSNTRQTFQSFISLLAERKGDLLASSRARLMKFLNYSDQIRLVLFKSRLDLNPRLYAEHAILLRKLGQHEEALRVLVTNMRDFMGAEIYCSATIPSPTIIKHSNKSPSTISSTRLESDSARKVLLFQLLKLYLKDEKRDELAEEILRLLGVYGAEFDVIEVLKVIPDNWSLNMLVPFISASSRRSVHFRRELIITKALARGESLKVNNEFVDIHLKTPPIRISLASPSSNCAKCQLPVSDNPPVFCRYPQTPDEVFHLHCRMGVNRRPITEIR